MADPVSTPSYRKRRATVGPDLRQLRQVVAIVDTGSFNRASQVLGIAQPTLSRSIARLEDQLGVSLFDRSGVAVRPTQLGVHLADRARGLIQEANAVTHWLQLLSQGESGSLRIGFGPVPRDMLLGRALGAIVDHFPQLKVEVAVASAEPLFRQLLARELDLVVVNARRFSGDDSVETVPILYAPFVLVAHPGHPLVRRKHLEWRDLLPYQLVESGIDADVARVIDPAVVDALVANTMLCADFAAIREMVRKGPYLSIAPRPVFAADLAAGKLVEIDLAIGVDYGCMVAMNREGRLSPVLLAITDLLRDAARAAG